MANKIKISGCEPVKYGPHDFQLGDYVYAPVSSYGPQQGNQLAYIDKQDNDGCSIVFVQTNRKVLRLYSELYLVPITEEWLKENPQVFTPSDDIMQQESGLRFTYQYKFSAKRFVCDYYMVAYELHYEDEEEFQHLVKEGLSYFTCLQESQGKGTIAQIVRFISGSMNLGAGAMQIISIHDLQHFLRLCGCEELKAPQSLLED
jgi:hypothetical protein